MEIWRWALGTGVLCASMVSWLCLVLFGVGGAKLLERGRVVDGVGDGGSGLWVCLRGLRERAWSWGNLGCGRIRCERVQRKWPLSEAQVREPYQLVVRGVFYGYFLDGKMVLFIH